MAIRSRKLQTRTVTVSALENPEDKLTVTIRALRESEKQWMSERNIEIGMDFEVKGENPLGFLRDMVRIGLIGVVDPPVDPDTGRPFEFVTYRQKVGNRKVELVSDDTLDALADYVAPIANEIGTMLTLSDEERDAARPTGKSVEPKSLELAAPVKEEKPTAPSTA